MHQPIVRVMIAGGGSYHLTAGTQHTKQTSVLTKTAAAAAAEEVINISHIKILKM